MAHEDEKPSSYRTPHEGPASGGAADAPREALGRVVAPVLGPVDLELSLGRPLRVDLDAEHLDLEPGSGLVARIPDLPTVELRRLRVDLTRGTVHADADALGPFILTAIGAALRLVLGRALGWQPGRSVALLLAQNLPADPRTGARRVFAGPLGASAWLDLEARASVELRADRAEVALTRAVVVRVLGVALPVLAVRLLFGEARLQIDPGPAGPLRRALLRLVAWVATRWLRGRMPAAMTIPGYDLFADEQRRARLVELARRLRGRGRPRRGRAEGHVPADMSLSTETSGQEQKTSRPAWLTELMALRLSAAHAGDRARVLATVPLGARGEIAVAVDPGADVVVTRLANGVRIQAAGGIFAVADGLPDLSELRVARVQATFLGGELALDVQTSPPLGPLLRALLRRLAQATVGPRVTPALLARLGFAPQPGDPPGLLFRQMFSATAGVELIATPGGDVRLRHTAEALVLEAPDGVLLRFLGLALLPDATIRRLEYRWSDGGLVADTTPDLGEFGAAAIGQIVRVRAAPGLPALLGVRADGGPTVDPLLEDQFPALLTRVAVAVVGPLDVRLDPDDTVRVRVAPDALGVTSDRRLLLVAPELRLCVQLRDLSHSLADGGVAITSEPPLGDYLSELVRRCVAQFAVPPLRRALPLWPTARPDSTWLLAQVPKDSPKIRAELPPGAGLVLARDAESIAVRAEAPLQLVPAEDAPLIAEVALEAVRFTPAGAEVELVTEPAAGALLHAAARRLLLRFVAPERLAALAKQLALPAPIATPPAPPPIPGVVVWEQAAPGVGPLRVSLDIARTIQVSLDRRGATISLGKGATVRAPELGFDLTVHSLALSFMPWTVDIETTPAAGELERHALSHALRALFAAFMRHFWPTDRSPKAGHDTLLSLGADRPWGPLKVCVARGGSIDLRLDREGLSLKSTSGLFVTGEAIDWLPDFYLHELSMRAATTAIKLSISGIQEQHYHEAAPVSPITEAVLSHLLRVLVLPKVPEVWRQRLGLPKVSLPPAPTVDASRVVAFAATLPGDYGELLVSMDAGDTITVRATDVEVSVESTRGLMATMPGLRLALQLRGARYHLQSGEVQIGGLGQLENALIEAILQRQAASRGGEAAASGVRALLDRLPTDDKGRIIVFRHRLVSLLLDPKTAIRMTLDDAGLRVIAEPPLTVDGPAKMNYTVSGVHYSFQEARFEIDVDGDGAFAEIFEGLIDKQVEKRLNDQLLPLLPVAMRTPGYRLTTDPNARENIAALIRSFARKRAAKA